jgi:hypothetical protein
MTIPEINLPARLGWHQEESQLFTPENAPSNLEYYPARAPDPLTTEIANHPGSNFA